MFVKGEAQGELKMEVSIGEGTVSIVGRVVNGAKGSSVVFSMRVLQL